MSETTKIRMFQITAHGLLLFVLCVLQGMVFPALQLWGTVPLLFPLAVVAVGLFEGPTWGGVFGLLAGFLSDLFFAESLVLFMITLTLLGMGLGLLSVHLLNRRFLSYILCAGASLLLLAFLQAFPFLVYQRVAPWILLGVALRQTLLTILFAPLLYLIIQAMPREE